MHIVFAIITAYFVGAIPTAYIFGRMLKGIDIREYGSGNVGATNVFRIVGKIPGFTVFGIDFLKGIVAVTAVPAGFQRFAFGPIEFYPIVYIALGAAAITGHIWPIFLKFRGGKGVATTAGVLAGLSPGIFLACFGIWLVVFGVWRYVSLASVTAAVTLPIVAVLAAKSIEFVIFCAVVCLVGVYAHRANIKRLIQGTERKLLK